LIAIILQYAYYKEEAPKEGKINGGKVIFFIPNQQIDPKAVARQFLHKHKKEIQHCQNKDQQTVAFAVSELKQYFDLKNEQVSLLVDNLFSLKSKLKIGYYYVRGNGRLENYLQEETVHCLGGPEELRNEIEKITSALKMALEQNHNELMLVLEADLALLPYNLKISNRHSNDFVNDFEIAFGHAMEGLLPRTVGMQLGVEAVCLAIDTWIAPVIGAAIVNFLVSRGIMAGGALAAEGAAVGTGASLGPSTFGASLVVGVIIAIGIDWTCNEIAKADAEKKIMASLDAWREGTITSFKGSASDGLGKFHNTRQLALKSALVQEISNLAKENNL
ncbi:MAG: hypothetical protein U9R17_07310, partial [Thermodesulfobacteriota bacterium]|nr:hypothetical protein [Thermodesulfobacteriota bacterium]